MITNKEVVEGTNARSSLAPSVLDIRSMAYLGLTGCLVPTSPKDEPPACAVLKSKTSTCASAVQTWPSVVSPQWASAVLRAWLHCGAKERARSLWLASQSFSESTDAVDTSAAPAVLSWSTIALWAAVAGHPAISRMPSPRAATVSFRITSPFASLLLRHCDRSVG